MAMNDDEFRALQEQAHLVEELTQHPGWQELVAVMHDRMRPDKTHLLNGNAGSFDDYRYKTGRLVGVHEVLDMPGKIVELRDSEADRRAERNAG